MGIEINVQNICFALPNFHTCDAKQRDYQPNYLNPSDMLPNFTLYRGEKKSTGFLLDNDAENSVKGKAAYFMVSADTIKNIGIPNKIGFAAGGNHSTDGWEFDELKVDVFAGKDWNMEAMLTAMKLKNLNSRDAVLNTDAGGVFVKDALIATIEFPGHHGIDGDEEHGQNNPHSYSRIVRHTA